jgi:tartrate dehydrogenase/decarboxylase/D-malate dehydrogenase
MNTYKIAVIRGDGIGIEVVEEGLKVLSEVSTGHGFHLEFEEFPWGSDYYNKTGQMMPSTGIDSLSQFDAIFLGAVGHPDIQDHITLNGLLLPIRRRFDQYVCERPSVLYPGITSPLSNKSPYEINMVVIRENTEGEYANVGGFQYAGFPSEVGIQTGIFTRMGCERVIRYAFQLTRRRDNKKHLTSVTKSNAQGYGMLVWDKAFERVALEFPDIETDSLLVDAAAMDFIRKPESFDVVVGSNLFGDILTDIGAIITGSMGLASSANLDPERRYPSMFEPVHGSAPDIMGQGIANPLAQILTAGMLLTHLGEIKAADDIEKSVKSILSQAQVLTPDLGGTATTEEVGDEVVRSLGKVQN